MSTFNPWKESINSNETLYYLKVIGDVPLNVEFLEISFLLSYEQLYGAYRKDVDKDEKEIRKSVSSTYEFTKLDNVNPSNVSSYFNTNNKDNLLASILDKRDKNIGKEEEILVPHVTDHFETHIQSSCIGLSIFSSCVGLTIGSGDYSEANKGLNDIKKIMTDYMGKTAEDRKLQIETNAKLNQGIVSNAKAISDIAKQTQKFMKDFVDYNDKKFKLVDNKIDRLAEKTFAMINNGYEATSTLSDAVSRMYYDLSRAIQLIGDSSKLFSLEFDEINYANSDVDFIMCELFNEDCKDGHTQNPKIKKFMSNVNVNLIYEQLCNQMEGIVPFKPCKLLGVTQSVVHNIEYSDTIIRKYGSTKKCTANHDKISECYPYVFNVKVPYTSEKGRIPVYEATKIKSLDVIYEENSSFTPIDDLPDSFRIAYSRSPTENSYINYDINWNDLTDDNYGSVLYTNQVKRSKIINLPMKKWVFQSDYYDRSHNHKDNFKFLQEKYKAEIKDSMMLLKHNTKYVQRTIDELDKCFIPPQVSLISKCNIVVYSTRDFMYSILNDNVNKDEKTYYHNINKITFIKLKPGEFTNIRFTYEKGCQQIPATYETYRCPREHIDLDVPLPDALYRRTLVLGEQLLDAKLTTIHDKLSLINHADFISIGDEEVPKIIIPDLNKVADNNHKKIKNIADSINDFQKQRVEFEKDFSKLQNQMKELDFSKPIWISIVSSMSSTIIILVIAYIIFRKFVK